MLAGLKGENLDQDAGIRIVGRALEDPLRQIVENAGEEASVVVNRVAGEQGNFGYNAAKGVYGDMVEMGVLDPCKVTRTALQNAASISGLILTTACMVARKPQPAAALPRCRRCRWAGKCSARGAHPGASAMSEATTARSLRQCDPGQ